MKKQTSKGNPEKMSLCMTMTPLILTRLQWNLSILSSGHCRPTLRTAQTLSPVTCIYFQNWKKSALETNIRPGRLWFQLEIDTSAVGLLSSSVPTFLVNSCQLYLPSVYFVAGLLYLSVFPFGVWDLSCKSALNPRWSTLLTILRRWSGCYSYSLLLYGLFYEDICFMSYLVLLCSCVFQSF